MLTTRKADDRGRTKLSWLDGRHSFSFGHYHDPENTRFRTLRVINDDIVSPGTGFDTHPHRDMEIITYVISGALEHKDSTGGGGVITPGDVQAMSAGTGVFHSEFNHSKSDPVRLLQVWIEPERRNLDPGYDQKHFTRDERIDRLCPIATPDGRDGSLRIRQDASIFASVLSARGAVRHDVDEGRGVWVQIATGEVRIHGQTFVEGDGVAIEGERVVDITGVDEHSEMLVFDLL